MKTTTSATFRTLQHNLGKTSDRLNGLYVQSATGLKMTKASDNPAAVGPLLNARKEISSTDRYLNSITSSQDQLDILDGYLDSAEDILARAKEIAVSGMNEAMSDEDLETLASEVESLQDELLQIANVKVDGKYLFSGYADQTEPFSGDPPTYQGTLDHKFVAVGEGETVQTNLTGVEVFTQPIDAFAVLADLASALRSGDSDSVSTQLENLNTAAETVSTKRSQMGNINSHLDTAAAQKADYKLQMEDLLSRYQDADLVEVLSDVTAEEQAMEAALQVAARVGQLTLLDYL